MTSLDLIPKRFKPSINPFDLLVLLPPKVLEDYWKTITNYSYYVTGFSGVDENPDLNTIADQQT